MSLHTIKDIIPTLSHEERKELLGYLIDSFVQAAPTAAKTRSLHELRGLGKDIWSGIDAQDYINQERDDWDH